MGLGWSWRSLWVERPAEPSLLHHSIPAPHHTQVIGGWEPGSVSALMVLLDFPSYFWCLKG